MNVLLMFSCTLYDKLHHKFVSEITEKYNFFEVLHER